MTNFCEGHARTYPGSPHTRPCARVATRHIFIPEDDGATLQDGVRGTVRGFCGWHDPRRNLPDSVKLPRGQSVGWKGRRVELLPDRAEAAIRLVIRLATGEAVTPNSAADLLGKWEAEDGTARERYRRQLGAKPLTPPMPTKRDIEDMFG